jgi:hypothetical protein
MAITAVNLQYAGQTPGAIQSQQISSQGGLTGTTAKALYGVGTAVLDGSSTTFTLNWIDGVQTPFKTTVTSQVLTAAAAVTIGGVANQAVYSGVGAFGQLRVGQSVTFAGFTNSGNNGTFTVNALTTSTIQVTNSSSVAETNPAGTVTFTPLNIAVGVGVVQPGNGANARAYFGPFNNVADTAASTTTAIMSAISQTGCTITISAAGSAAQLLSVYAILYPSL